MRCFDKIIVPRNGERVLFRGRLHWTVFCYPSSILTLFLLPLVKWLTCEAVVTSRRVVFVTGWLHRRIFEVPTARIESIRVEQSLLARLLGFGSVQVVGVGGGWRWFTHVAHPLAFRRAAEEAMHGS